MGWELMVIDDIRYVPDAIGLRQSLAVTRHARAIVRAHGGFALGSTTDRGFPPQEGTPPVIRQNFGSQPVVPLIPEIAAPPLGNLALTPDAQPLRAPRLEGLDAVHWSELGCEEVPGLIAGLVHEDWDKRLRELIQSIVPGGECNPGTGPAVTFLAQLLVNNALTAIRRCGVYWTLIDIATRYTADLIRGADVKAVTRRLPRPQVWSQQAREAVDAIVPSLLIRWDIEPPANRLALVTLAAIFRAHGQVLADRAVDMAAAQEGTRVGICARIAYQLIVGSFEDAARNATAMSLWDDESYAEYDLGDELIEPLMLAEAVLSSQVEQLLSVWRKLPPRRWRSPTARTGSRSRMSSAPLR